VAQTEKTPDSEEAAGSSAGPTTRRAVLCVACALPLLAACGSSTGSLTGAATAPPTAPAATKSAGTKKRHRQQGGAGGSANGTSTSSASAETASTSAPAPAGALVQTSQVPVGGGVVLFKKGYVVTQPTKGTFHGFSTICTHAGCQVGAVYGGTIDCPCHGSKFSITDGAVVHGPARIPLPSKGIAVKSGWVVKA
jgi:Rieske Fe-S protein